MQAVAGRSAIAGQVRTAGGCGRRLASAVLWLAAASSAVAFAQAPAGDAPPRLYELVVEISMPHLDENMRYATRRERLCLGPDDDPSSTFSMLKDVSLSDCRLEPAEAVPDGERSVLRCTGGHGTTGEARWHRDGDSLSGALEVRLGGKNMTFHQRVRGRALGACPEVRR